MTRMETQERQVRRRDATKESKTGPTNTTKRGDAKARRSKYGPMPTFPYQRVWSHSVIVIGICVIVYFTVQKEKESTFALQAEILPQRALDVPCSNDYGNDMYRFPECVTSKCGRLVADRLITPGETQSLQSMAERAFFVGGSGSGVSVLDLKTGSLSHGEDIINIHYLDQVSLFLKRADFELYKIVRGKIQKAIANHFGILSTRIHLTQPTFLSRMTPEATPHLTEGFYGRPSVDKYTHPEFVYSAIIYLSDFRKDFQGGRLIFMDKEGNRTVEPRKGRLLMFTSGRENRHFVERVVGGTRYALVMGFTCDESRSIADPFPDLKEPEESSASEMDETEESETTSEDQ